MTGAVSVLVPARNEEDVLPSTLPSVLAAAHALSRPVTVAVIAPCTSVVHQTPPLTDPLLRWIPTAQPGKFAALRAGVTATSSDTLILVDADVVIEATAFTHLLRPLDNDTADMVDGQVDVLARGEKLSMLERWDDVGAATWDLLRRESPEFLWAPHGAILAIRRELMPDSPLVPLMDDVSIGLHAKERGARFAYAAKALVHHPAPRTLRDWGRQKYRSKRGWAALARLRPDDIGALERALGDCAARMGAGERTMWLASLLDRGYRGAAQISLALKGMPSGAWRSGSRALPAPARQGSAS